MEPSEAMERAREHLGEDAAPPESRVDNRQHIIREIKRDLYMVNADIAALQERRKKIKGRIKSDLGEKVSDFNMMIRLLDLEGDERDRAMDLIREGFKALGLGEQGSLLNGFDE